MLLNPVVKPQYKEDSVSKKANKVTIWMFLTCISSFAQEDWQSRDVARLAFEIGKKCYLPFWSISNIKTETRNNTNLVTGLGYGTKKNWAEAMVQRQWNYKGGFWAVDFRFRAQPSNRLVLYFEPGKFIDQPGFYESAFVDVRAWKGLSVGAETENIHRPKRLPEKEYPRLITAGPRLAIQLGSRWGFDYSAVVAYRFSLTGPNERRLYFFASKRFSLRGRKQ